MSLTQNIIDINKEYKLNSYIDEKKEVDNLPVGVNISTMCATAKIKLTNNDLQEDLNVEINIDNIEKYLQLDINNVITIKRNSSSIRTLLLQKIKTKRTKKMQQTKTKAINYFYNQITIVMRVNEGPTDDINNEPRINLKLFRNGSIQMSGCKSVKYINIVLNKLIRRLKETNAIIVDNNIVEIKFIANPDITITNFKIDMINSNYQVKLLVDRDKLYTLLKKKNIKCSFEPCIRACVVVKYTPPNYNSDEKQVSIYIFQKGNIIITGARDRDHIISAYNYINDILVTHYDEVNINDNEKNTDIILQLYDEIMEKVNKGLIKL
jgi:TATA-box binding protein (TBP) (component of TFIID and TFIIIB)